MQPNSVNKIITGLFTLTAVMMAGLQCEDPVKPPPPGPIELLEPLGGSGKSVKVGDTVTVRWSIHDRTNVSTVGITYSLDGGATVTNLQFLADGSFPPSDTTYRWIVDSSHVSERFVVIVYEYNNSACMHGNPSTCESLFDKSEPFAVRQ